MKTLLFENLRIFPNGEYYIGGFKNNKKSGYGEYFFDDNSTYKGNYHNDYANGSGVAVYTDGFVESGFWKNGEFQDQNEEYEEGLAGYANFEFCEENYEDEDGDDYSNQCEEDYWEQFENGIEGDY